MGAIRPQRRFGVEHEGQGLIIDADKLSRILSARAAVGDDGGDPFAHIARGADGERVALHMGRVEPVHHGLAGRSVFLAR